MVDLFNSHNGKGIRWGEYQLMVKKESYLEEI